MTRSKKRSRTAGEDARREAAREAFAADGLDFDALVQRALDGEHAAVAEELEQALRARRAKKGGAK